MKSTLNVNKSLLSLSQTASLSFNTTSILKSNKPKQSTISQDATVYMIGEIKNAYVDCKTAVYCRWEVLFNDKYWKVKHGSKTGQTLISEPTVLCIYIFLINWIAYIIEYYIEWKMCLEW